MMNLTNLGGVKEYGRNCFLLTDHTTNARIMLDCGVRNGSPEVYPEITEEIAQSLQAVFISHVHNDHIGALPLLAEKGFSGEVWMSEASLAQLPPIISLWQQKNPDAPLTNLQFRALPKTTRGKEFTVMKNLHVTWGYSGHMLGSIWYSFRVNEETFFYSGDMALDSPLLVTDQPVLRFYDHALIDSGHAAYTMPYQRSIQNIQDALSDPLKPYHVPVNLSGKACDLLFSLYHALPDQTFFIDQALNNHLHAYLQYPDHVREERIHEFTNMLQSDRLQLATETKQPGIYLTKQAPFEMTNIQTGIYLDQSSPFYKSHPDRDDLSRILSYIKATQVTFFHSKEQDLEIILKNQTNGGIML
ncbi:MBL fold metallo-hydrolase [Alkalicoccobacillus gibsonii]|uniref:MBL fold metallo-hydrolase n=1 Tax=Alkalicoccobacillus gibsonii TaxID=79881 RepID=A0ABU9VRB6_9BACI